jgi:hypothetical protein
LAERYRPELRLAVEENFGPGPVELMLGLPGSFLRYWPNEGFEPVRNPGFADLEDSCAEPACYIDLLGSSVEAGGGESSCTIDRGTVSRTYLENYRSHVDEYPPVIYARVKPAGGGAVIQYWINYAVNDHPRLFHEGDWEMVQVRLDENLSPYRADYSQHSTGQWREWKDVAKQGSTGERPVVYVAAGSHASYFRPGEFELVRFLAWDIADGSGATISPQIQVIPEVGEAAGDSSWLAFEGRWGEQTGATMCLPSIPGVFDPNGHRDGPPGPAFQGAKWNDPLGWLDDAACDGCEAAEGEGVVLGVMSFAGGDVHVFDASGNHLGVNADGGIDNQIVGAELLEYVTLGGAGAIMPGADAASGYRVEIVGAGSGSVYMTIPDRESGRVDSVRYDLVENVGSARMSINLDGQGEYDLAVDVNDDGSPDHHISPALIETRYVDLLPPLPATDIAASAYDLRFSLAPIDAENWRDAIPLPAPGPPSPPGGSETIMVTELQAGTLYYFAVRTVDAAGRSSPVSNVASGRTRAPELAWYLKGAQWDSYDDFISRSLTVDFEVRNKGTATALATRIEASIAAPSGCFALSPMPMMVGDIDVDSGRMVTIKYRVPAGILGLLTRTYASCMDAEGGEYRFPDSLQQD